MRFFVLMIIYCIVAITLQTTVLSGLPSNWVRFDFLIILVAALSFFQGWRRAVPIILIMGSLVDVTSATPFGISILSYLVIFLVIRAIISKISFQGGIALLLWIMIVSLFDKSLRSLVLVASAGGAAHVEFLIRGALFQAMLDAVLGVLLIPFIKAYWDLSWEKISRPKGLVFK
jgi:cell shape-determining protein MreD